NPVEGQTLSTTNGSWTGQSPTYSYQWQRCDSVGGNCAPISGATANTYLLASADIGHAIRAAVTATNSGGAATGTSQPTAAVTQAPPSNTSLPTVTGTPHPGQTLTGTTGSWTGSPTYAYQWQRCDTGGASCAAIAGETATTHLLTSSDVDHTIRFQVTATNGGGSVPATSNATPLVKDPPVNTALPVISGPVHESQSLSTTDGTWTGNPTSFTYRWKRCDSGGAGCVAIAGATAASYLLTATDVGRTMRAEVTATNAGGSVAATSNATAVVTAAAFVPSIQGISPTSGVPGATVTLTGSRLYKASSVKFNGVAATIRSNDASSIEVLVPAAATNGPISIVTQDGNASSTQSFTVTPPPAPSISGFSPTHGVPGTVVTVSGSKLLGATAVKFNGSPGTVTSIAATAIKVVVPAGVTTGTVSVTTSGGTVTSNPKFTADAVPVPKITSFTPSSAYVGQTVTIKGSGLIGASVAFNGAAAAITSNTASAVKAIVPAGATTGKIAVTTAGGTVLSGATFTLKASPAPKITSFTPTSAVPGTAVTIKGSGFLGATSVKFGGVEAEVTSLTATVIKVLAPPGAPVDTISVTTPGGTAFSSGVFSLL
ncbi:MAG TPA: IPT/TIG domain-containing protein, partial [Gaiellaceae bacterium]|nr:IPT/TIG domain-containing protein [Gaiellaceae bacterium]